MAGKHDETGGRLRQSPDTRRAIGYARVSTRGQEERGMGLVAQERTIREYARAEGLELLEVVREAASGDVRDGEVFSHEHRPRLSALLDRARDEHGFAIVIVARLDRLSRDDVTAIFLERTFRRYGVVVKSATESNGDGAYAEFLRTVTAGVAKLERARILERVMAGKDERKRRGQRVHGRVPYGYRSVPAGDDQRGRTLVPDEHAAEVVRRIFRAVNGGQALRAVARSLTADGIEAPQGGSEWRPDTIRTIVSNPAYAGTMFGKRKAHKEIVSQRTWERAQSALRARSR